MDEPTALHHWWPEDEIAADAVPVHAWGVRARLCRILGDVLLAAGIGNGLATRGVDDPDAMTNVICFEEGRSKVRQAHRSAHRS